MKTILWGALMGWFLLPLPLIAQKSIEKSANYQAGQEIIIELKFASKIKLVATDQSVVSIKSSVSINGDQHNDKYELQVEENASELKIPANLADIQDIAEKRIQISDKNSDKQIITYGNSWYSEDGVRISSGKEIIVEISHEIQVPRNANLTLKTIGGDIDAEYLSGAINLKTVKGDIDIKVPANANRTFLIKSRSDVYSDLNIDFPDLSSNGLSRVGGGGKYKKTIEGKLNQGGTAIELKTYSGYIFLRKNS